MIIKTAFNLSNLLLLLLLNNYINVYELIFSEQAFVIPLNILVASITYNIPDLTTIETVQVLAPAEWNQSHTTLNQTTFAIIGWENKNTNNCFSYT